MLQVAMMFVRCRGGISHSPAEYVSQADVAVATKALYWFLKAQQGNSKQGNSKGAHGEQDRTEL